ncbi:MAG: hypothetical protein ACO1SV_02830 [Fimbriimonas sp.]
MIDRKRLLSFAMAFAVFSSLYAFTTWRTGTSPGLFVPSVFFFLSWFIGQVMVESLYLKDKVKWHRAAATVGAVVAVVTGLGFLVVVDHTFSPVTLGVRSVVDLAFGYAAVAIGMRIPRFRRH